VLSGGRVVGGGCMQHGRSMSTKAQHSQTIDLKQNEGRFTECLSVPTAPCITEPCFLCVLDIWKRSNTKSKSFNDYGGFHLSKYFGYIQTVSL